MRLSSNMNCNSDDENNFPHIFTNVRKVFANNSSTGIKLPKTQLSKMI